MSEKYLNSSVKFKCKCNAVFEVPFPTANVVIGGSKVLLSSNHLVCTLSGTCALCPLPNGQPGPCRHFGTGPVLLPWTDPSAAALHVNKSRVLSSKSSCTCLMGQKIVPFGYEVITVSDDIDSFAVSVSSPSHISSADGRDASGVSEAGKNVPVEAGETSEARAEEEIPLEEKCRYALCNYKSCGKAASCKYLDTPSSIKGYGLYDGDSGLLKRNMQEFAKESYNDEVGKICTAYSHVGKAYTVQHHHMISSRQCYDKVPELVKLGNFYQYNINSGGNGIALPSGGGYKDVELLDDKIKITFRAMDEIGKQWHVGGHSMNLLINSLTKIKALIEVELSKDASSVITGYDQSVTSLLNLFVMKNKDRYLDSCRVENYEQQRDEFCAFMDRISGRIRTHLIEYNSNPKNHKWFYISKMALYYAYEDVLKDYKDKIF